MANSKKVQKNDQKQPKNPERALQKLRENREKIKADLIALDAQEVALIEAQNSKGATLLSEAISKISITIQTPGQAVKLARMIEKAGYENAILCLKNKPTVSAEPIKNPEKNTDKPA